jgi:hypothetical protein
MTDQKKPWAAIGIVSTDAHSAADEIARAANKLEEMGYEVRDPMLYGQHIIVYGRIPYIVQKEVVYPMDPAPRGPLKE